MAQLAALFGKVLLLMGFGFALAKAGVMTQERKGHLSTFLMKAVLPVNLLSSAGQAFSRKNAFGMLEILLISAAYYLISLLAVGAAVKKWNPDDQFRGIFVNLAVFANVGFIGFPILQDLFGETGTLYTIAYNTSYQLFFFTYGLFLLEGKKKFSLKNLFGNSIVRVSVASMLLYVSGLRFPSFVQSAMTSVGGMMVPISLMIIGYEIAQIRFREILLDRPSYLVSALRLFVMPAALALVLSLCRAERTVAVTAVLLTALPAGSLTVIVAQENGSDTPFAARAVAQSTFLMLVTLPLMFLFSGILFGGP